LTSDFLLSLAQAIAKGLLTGMVYGLMALDLSVIFGVMRVVNFAHGEMMVVGMYLAWAAFSYAEVTPIISRPEHQQFLLLLAIATLLAKGALAMAGPDSRAVQLVSQFDSYEVGPL